MKRLLVISASIMFLLPSIGLSGIRYSITDLGIGRANSINNEGQIVGSFGIWDNGNTTILAGEGRAINNNGQVIFSRNGTGYLWQNGSETYIGGYANGINDNGVIVGRNTSSAWKWDSVSGKQYLGNGITDVYGINSSNQIVGLGRNKDNLLVSTVYNGNGNVINLATFGGIVNDSSAVNGCAKDINSQGQVVGFARNAENTYYDAFIWDNINGLQNLGRITNRGGIYAMSINDSSEVVGYYDSYTPNSGAFIWNENDGMIDLNSCIPTDSGWDYISIARDINIHGQIVGEGYINGQSHAFLLTPVPEPMSLCILGLGALFLRKRPS